MHSIISDYLSVLKILVVDQNFYYWHILKVAILILCVIMNKSPTEPNLSHVGALPLWYKSCKSILVAWLKSHVNSVLMYQTCKSHPKAYYIM